MPDIRDLPDLLADLYTRQREEQANKNRIVQKYVSVQDQVSFYTDTVTATMTTGPYHWATDSASTDSDLVWSLSEWA